MRSQFELEEDRELINRAASRVGQSVTLKLSNGTDLQGTMTAAAGRTWTVTAAGPVVWTVPVSSVLAVGA
ncbi:hypothetical protein [Lentzea nigeriaca]|uniref:hypothetical protein n=1 Tax=Lentzea nigeriaca TaxID=1128665 RepID=UPI00195EC2C0|nr:hypothetical protein [Lentzea nigeriaca]MBM7860416.1 hypothetical protein [Lentzea nigeriaca]